MRRKIIGVLVGGVLIAGVIAGGLFFLQKDRFSCMKTDDINYLCDFAGTFDEEVRFRTAPSQNTCGKDDGDLRQEGWTSCFNMEPSASCTTVNGTGYVTVRAGAGALAVPSADIEVIDIATGGMEYNTTLEEVTTVGLADERVREAPPTNKSRGFVFETPAFDPGAEYRVSMYLRESELPGTFSPIQLSCMAVSEEKPPSG